MPQELQFDRDAEHWPNRAASRLVEAGGVRWHVQIAGEGPVLLLLHGTGASTHSFAGLVPRLSAHFTVVAPDLPGHAFTEAPKSALSLQGMARALSALLTALKLDPAAGAGHSAGAAILARMTLDGLLKPKALISLNGAFVPFDGAVSRLFSPLAKLLVLNPLVPQFVTWRAADRRAVERLLAGTGSNIPSESLDIYARLFRTNSHVTGTLAMMASWDLASLYAELSRLAVPLLLVAADNDKTVPPGDARLVARLVPQATVLSLPGLGHLAHEEDPGRVTGLIVDFTSRHGADRH